MKRVQIGDCLLIEGDCLSILPELEAGSVDAVCTDPPYFKVKDEAWDRQWDKPVSFLRWLKKCRDEWYRLLAPNGSLYCFASPKMAARVETLIAGRFCVLNRVRWVKEAGWHQKAEKETLRSFLSPWEEILFAEHYNADNIAKGEAGYIAKCDELRGFVFEPLRAYLESERKRAGVDKAAINAALGFSPTPGGMASRHYFSRSQWCLPTREHYEKMRQCLSELNHGGQYLRREYEDLRREYEDLRRPFKVTPQVPYTDVWTFPTVQAKKGKHPCQKPLAMMEHIVTASTREGATVLDCFAGSGTTGVACAMLGRKSILVEKDPHYFEIACKRIEKAYAELTETLFQAEGA